MSVSAIVNSRTSGLGPTIALHRRIRFPWEFTTMTQIKSADLVEALDRVEIGDAVAVRTRYLESWTAGFEVVEVLDIGYRVRRISDGALVDAVFAFEDVRRPDLKLWPRIDRRNA